MRLIDAARARLALFFRPRAADDGQEAMRRARVAFGGVEKHKEDMRDGRNRRWLSGLSLDFKLGVRMLVKYPGLTLVGLVGLSVAVAIGAVGFSAIYGVIDARLPFDGGERVVAIRSVDVRTGNDSRTALHDISAWSASVPALEAIGAYRTIDQNLITHDGRSESVRVAEMSASGFRLANSPPLLGRYFHDADQRLDAPAVVVIGESVWQDVFGGRRDIVGSVLWLGANAYTVVGVMPSGFAFPVNNRIWTPLRLDPATYERGQEPTLGTFARLAAGASAAQAQQQLATVESRLAALYPTAYEHVRPQLSPYTRSFIDHSELLWAFHLAEVLITMLLVVIGTNVAVLVYARTMNRAGEIAVRIALGASRSRVIAQLFAEALVLSAIASAVGLGIAHVALHQIDALLAQAFGEQLPFWLRFGVTPGVVVYAAALAVIGAVIVGIVPALKATRSHVHANLQLLGSGGAAIPLGRSWTMMIVAQVAVAVFGIPFAITSVHGVRASVTPRYASMQFLVGQLFFDDRAGGADAATRSTLLRTELARRVAAEPGVVRVVFSSDIVGNESSGAYEIAGDTSAGGAPNTRGFHVDGVEPAFFDAFDVPILVGRGFRSGDAQSSDKPVIVNESFVRSYLGDGNPLGRRVRSLDYRGGREPRRLPWQTIVGVVPNFPLLSDTAVGLGPRLYWPLDPNDARSLAINVRVAAGDPAAFGNRLREIALSVSPTLRLTKVASLLTAMGESLGPMQLALTGILALVTSVLLLSAAGMYALMSLTIARRRREIGIRSALGAGAARLIAGVFVRAAGQISIGIAVGVAALYLFEAGPRGGKMMPDELEGLVVTVTVIVAVGLASAVGPAWKALRIPPTEALRSE